MDDATINLGLLMEAAHSQQKLADRSLRKLQANTQELASMVRSVLHAALAEELQELASESERAAGALRALRRSARMRTLLWSIGITMLCSMVPLALALWWLPSRAEVESLRSQRERLQRTIVLLEERGGRIELRRCGVAGRLCARVDRQAPVYGDRSDYLILRGY